MTYQYNVLPVNLPKGSPTLRLEPIVGKWYVGADLVEGPDVVYGALARYEGDGVFVDYTDEGWEEVDMRGYDYLVEQR